MDCVGMVRLEQTPFSEVGLTSEWRDRAIPSSLGTFGTPVVCGDGCSCFIPVFLWEGEGHVSEHPEQSAGALWFLFCTESTVALGEKKWKSDKHA